MPPKKKKFESTFPAARIKKIMQLDDDVGRVASSVPVLLSARAVEIFLHSLLARAADYATDRNAKTLTVSHLKHSIEREKQWDFLKDLVAKVSDVAGHQAAGEEASTSKRGRKRQSAQPRAPRGKRKQVQPRPEEDDSDNNPEDAKRQGSSGEGGGALHSPFSQRQGSSGEGGGALHSPFSHSHTHHRTGPSGNIIHVPLLSTSSVPQRLTLPPASSHVPNPPRALPMLHLPPVPPLIHGLGHGNKATSTTSATVLSTVAGGGGIEGTVPSLAVLTAGLKGPVSQQEEEEDYDA